MAQDAGMATRKSGEGERTMELIPVIVEAEEQMAPTRTLGGTPRGLGEPNVRQLDVDKLRASFGKLSGQVTAILQDVRQVGDFKLKEVSLQVEITAEAGVNLVGNLKAGTKGAITLTFSA